MTEIKDAETKAEPLFARFLEQQVPAVKTNIKAGPPPFGPPPPGDVTMKWPSDDDEGGETS
ncbi:MAG: microviridin/marinostatin family tricyclic proteinase inhibitor [Phycisphaerales bacterium]|nr:microviridin/marinostatin family tricyclic proteinase inhibitor [Phycisphaerales bacterium]MCI0629317.1 microviridin/marinostatin family tricyclic proteinase inhibitor [Phycisphaerales bacterium]MCI0675550.1 microviridin/marinostatin family tricyclic proteinase inhibitor [Phycisphaerales bacterium]